MRPPRINVQTPPPPPPPPPPKVVPTEVAPTAVQQQVESERRKRKMSRMSTLLSGSLGDTGPSAAGPTTAKTILGG